MRVDYICNKCGYEFSLDSQEEEKRCLDCEDEDIFSIPIRIPDEGYQSCIFDE